MYHISFVIYTVRAQPIAKKSAKKDKSARKLNKNWIPVTHNAPFLQLCLSATVCLGCVTYV